MFTVSQGTANELSEVYLLILKWAELEGILPLIRITEETLEARLFCDRPSHFSAVARAEDQIIGFTLFNFTQDNVCLFVSPGLFIEALYVLPAFYQKGVGSALFSHVVNEAKKHHCSRLEGWVFNQDTSATAFYQSKGARPLDDLMVYRMQLK